MSLLCCSNCLQVFNSSLLCFLQRFAEAEEAFMQVLKLDKNCEDATTELVRVRTHQLTVSPSPILLTPESLHITMRDLNI